MGKDNVYELSLVNDENIEWETVGEGVRRKIMTYNDKLMLVKVAFEKGAIGTVHSHPHLQISYVAEGVFEVTMGNEKKILKAGDVFFALSEVEHGVNCLETGVLVDVFNPMREDFL